MSTRNQTPVGIALLVVIGGAIGAAMMASKLLGYLSSTSVATRQPTYWEPLLGTVVPGLVIVGVLVFVYIWIKSL